MSFASAQLTEVDLRTAKFERANFQGANLSRAILRRANLRPYSFVGARFEGADVAEAQGEGVNFSRSDLSRGSFRQANLKRANFAECRGHDPTFGTLLIGATSRSDLHELTCGSRGRSGRLHGRGLSARPRERGLLRGHLQEDQDGRHRARIKSPKVRG